MQTSKRWKALTENGQPPQLKGKMREVADEEKAGERGYFGVNEAKEGENIKK